ncbi:LysR family transcriptional regulator [Azospirillum himalayense]|uniref:LysR family transcriptional regulator n=1 Tax=Azospirillum himalayense TaxID=654847 RepID=A0ABW0G9J1_9PROT
MEKGDWDDLRFILAVSRSDSVSQAARQLGVNESTVVRRLANAEKIRDAPVHCRKAMTRGDASS